MAMVLIPRWKSRADPAVRLVVAALRPLAVCGQDRLHRFERLQRKPACVALVEKLETIESRLPELLQRDAPIEVGISAGHRLRQVEQRISRGALRTVVHPVPVAIAALLIAMLAI